jgi:NAD(P)-dependent dehydrogenase (short-subunit alcohol dehydrogenase family)
MEQSLLGLSGKVALITGGAAGIGRGCAVMLARAGCNIAIADVDKRGAEKTAREIHGMTRRATAIEVDVRKAESIAKMLDDAVKALGRLDICINNVGSMAGHRPTPFLDATSAFFEDVIANNLRATYWCCHAEAKSFIARGVRGSIINISSLAGIRAVKGLSPYGAAKAGIINLTQNLALELAPHGIRVNAIAPATTGTEKMTERMAQGAFRPVEEANPLKRLGTPEDMGGAAVFLASALAGYVTGHTIVVDGGVSLTTPRPAP